MATTLAFNALMLVVDAAVLLRLRAKRSLAAAGTLAVIAAAVGLVATVALAQERFDALRLAGWAVFGHGIVLSMGTATVFWRARRAWSLVAAAVAATLGLIAADAFLIEPEWLDVTHFEITSAKLSRPCRIAVLADFHVARVGPYERTVIRNIAEARPDVLLLAGDYLQAAPSHWEEVQAELNTMLREANLAGQTRVFAVQGNMESRGWAATFKDLNFTTILTTESFELGGALRLTGLSVGSSFDPSTQVSADPDHYHIVLGHCPNFALGNVPADLLIAGHTHGGQVRLPIVGALTTLSRIPRRWAAGLTELPGDRRLLVSRGIGMERGNAPQMRFLCRPELVVIDLAPARDTSKAGASSQVPGQVQ